MTSAESTDVDPSTPLCPSKPPMARRSNRARDVSREHTPRLGCRSLDVLHVASAMELELKGFLTFDSRQRQLAHAVGLKVVALPS